MKRLVFAFTIFFLLTSYPPEVEAGLDVRGVVAFLRGTLYESRGDYLNAYRYYDYALNKEPGAAKIKLSLARISLELGFLDKARLFSEELLQKREYEAEASMVLAQVEYLEGNKDKALGLLEKLKGRSDVPMFEILKFLSKIYVEMDKTDQALSTLEEAKKLFPDDVYVNYRLGIIYTKKGELDKAVNAFRSVVEMGPQFVEAHLALASILNHLGRLDEAETYYKNVLKLDPSNRAAFQDLAQLLYDRKKYEDAVEIFKPLYEAGDLDEKFAVTYGRFLYKAGKFDDAFRVFNALRKSQGDSPALIRVLAEIELERNHFKSAYRYLKELIELDPDDFGSYIGVLLLGFDLAGKPASRDEAVIIGEKEKMQYLEEASRMVPKDSFDGNYILGVIYGDLDRMKESEKFLLAAEKVNPDDRGLLIELASCFEKQRKFDEALVRLKKLYELYPDDPSIANFYGYVLAEKGERLDFAEQLLHKALKAKPDNGYYLDSLGWIFYRKGKLKEALEKLLAAVKAAGDDAVIWRHIGEVYERMGSRDKALEAYERSLRVDPSNGDLKAKVRELKRR